MERLYAGGHIGRKAKDFSSIFRLSICSLEDEKHFTLERLFLSMQDRLSPEKVNLLVQKGCESNIISFQDIICCEIIDRKVYLYLASGEVTSYYDRIENLEKKLDGRFFRCHRSYLINLNYLKSYRNNTAYIRHDRN